jgi:hypothetical protein
VVLGVLFAACLVVEPAALLGAAAWMSRRWSGRQEPLLPLVIRFSYALVPLGFGIWLAHYCFHLLTGLLTVVPVAQSALADLGMPLLGSPNWRLTGLPVGLVKPLDQCFLSLGLIGSLLVAWQIAAREEAGSPRTWRAFAPWAGLCVLLWLTALWLLAQPMEMRATFLGG